jgi:hypothetical protein
MPNDVPAFLARPSNSSRGEAHDTVIRMAREWTRLADEQVRATDLGQQQQQIQPDDDKKE